MTRAIRTRCGRQSAADRHGIAVAARVSRLRRDQMTPRPRESPMLPADRACRCQNHTPRQTLDGRAIRRPHEVAVVAPSEPACRSAFVNRPVRTGGRTPRERSRHAQITGRLTMIVTGRSAPRAGPHYPAAFQWSTAGTPRLAACEWWPRSDRISCCVMTRMKASIAGPRVPHRLMSRFRSTSRTAPTLRMWMNRRGDECHQSARPRLQSGADGVRENATRRPTSNGGRNWQSGGGEVPDCQPDCRRRSKDAAGHPNYMSS